MPTDDLIDWLGDAADQITSDQLETLRAESARLAARFPDPDEALEREAALSAVAQLIVGDATPEGLSRALTEARLAEARAYAAAEAGAVWLAGRGMARAAAARRCGIDRMSLLRALGERG